MNDIRSISDTLDSPINDVTVSVQLSAALDRMSDKSHTHDNCAIHVENEEIKNKVEMLMNLIGDISVSEQVDMAINRIKENT